MSNKKVSVMILAAGKGTRMQSSRPKVLHEIAGMPVLEHVLNAASVLNPGEIVLVTGPDMRGVEICAQAFSSAIRMIRQVQQKGTGDAVRIALSGLEKKEPVSLVLFGDTPLIQPETLKRMVEACYAGQDIVIQGFESGNPAYARLVLDATGALEAVVEARDASPEHMRSRLCNGGAMAVRTAILSELIGKITPENAQGEYYLTSIIELARARGLPCAYEKCDEIEALGINNRSDLALAESIVQQSLRKQALESGVTLCDPSSVYLGTDTQLAQDVLIESHVFIGKNVILGRGVHIRAFSYLEGVTVEEDAVIGPYARLRPGTRVGPGARVGNFVEIKKADIEAGAKINHLSYIGDARVGVRANIGAGTITCNYDGFNKYFTDIGTEAFVGSNSSLVAPLTIEAGAYIGSGSVITKAVAADSLAVARSRQTEKQGWASRFRKRKKNTAR